MKHWWKRILLTLLVLILAAGAGFGIYVSDYYKADARAATAQSQADILTRSHWTELEAPSDDIGFIFYPGAKVESAAYLPLMQQLRAQGCSCYLADMPFHLAFFGVNRADAIIAAHPEIQTWYIGGHSLGGAFAGAYAAKHAEQIHGVILLGAYLYGGYPASRSLTIYGSEDHILHRDKITYSDHVHVIAGGNHAQFGDYGVQKGDGVASISAEQQQAQTVSLIRAFLQSE